MAIAFDLYSMQMQEAAPVPAQQEVVFKSSGLHIILVGPKQELTTGEIVRWTLNSEKAESVTSQAPVKEP